MEDYLNNAIIHLSVGKLKWIVQRALLREINELLHSRMNSRLSKLLTLCAYIPYVLSRVICIKYPLNSRMTSISPVMISGDDCAPILFQWVYTNTAIL